MFLGNKTDVENYYNACTLTVLPSLFEGTPNVALESMACGIPIVASNVSDNAYIIPDGRAGFVVPLNDEAALADRVTRILFDRNLRQQLSTQARSWVAGEFSCQRLAEKTVAVYHEAMSLRHACKCGHHHGTHAHGAPHRRECRRSRLFPAAVADDLSMNGAFRGLVGMGVGVLLWLILRLTLLVTAITKARRTQPRGDRPLPAAPYRQNGQQELVPVAFDAARAHAGNFGNTSGGGRQAGHGAENPAIQNPCGHRLDQAAAIVRSIWSMVIAFQQKPDVIMAYSLFPPGVFSLMAARLTGKAAVVQLAGGIQEITSGGYDTEKPCIPGWMQKRLVALCHRVCAEFDDVVVRGRKAEAYLREHLQPRRVDIIPGSVDPVRFQTAARRRQIDLVFIGRIVPVKQPDHVVEIIKRVAQKRPGLRAVIAGRGPLLDEMKAKVKDLGLEKNVCFAGHVERVEGLLTRSKIFLLTSRSEGLSIALAEAMLAGTVPVVANVGDLSELVVSGQCGWLIKPGDFDDYAGKICDLLGDGPAWTKMSQEARAMSFENNSVDSVVRRWQRCLPENCRPGAPGLRRMPPEIIAGPDDAVRGSEAAARPPRRIVTLTAVLRMAGKLLAAMVLTVVAGDLIATRVCNCPTIYDPALGRIPKPGARFHWKIEGDGDGVWTSNCVRRASLPASNTNGCLLAIGDSYTEALFVTDEDYYAHRLEKRLRENHLDVPVLGVAKSGFSVADYIANAAMYRKLFSPSWVIVQVGDDDFCNDAWNTGKPEGYAHFRHAKGSDALDIIDLPPKDGGMCALASDHFPLLLPIVLFMQDRENVVLAWLKDRKQPWFHAESPEDTSKRAAVPEMTKYPVEEEMKMLAGSYDKHVILLYVARLDPLHPSHESENEAILRKAALAQGIRFVSLRDKFPELAAAGQAPFGFSNTRFNAGHWNRYGHQAAADLLYDEYVKITHAVH